MLFWFIAKIYVACIVHAKASYLDGPMHKKLLWKLGGEYWDLGWDEYVIWRGGGYLQGKQNLLHDCIISSVLRHGYEFHPQFIVSNSIRIHVRTCLPGSTGL